MFLYLANEITFVSGLNPKILTNLHTLELRGNKLETTKGIYLPNLKNLYLVGLQWVWLYTIIMLLNHLGQSWENYGLVKTYTLTFFGDEERKYIKPVIFDTLTNIYAVLPSRWMKSRQPKMKRTEKAPCYVRTCFLPSLFRWLGHKLSFH